MKDDVIYFVPLLALVRISDEPTECVWDRVEFMDLNFSEEGESIALCDGEAFYLKNSKVRQLFELVRNGYFEIQLFEEYPMN